MWIGDTPGRTTPSPQEQCIPCSLHPPFRHCLSPQQRSTVSRRLPGGQSTGLAFLPDWPFFINRTLTAGWPFPSQSHSKSLPSAQEEVPVGWGTRGRGRPTPARPLRGAAADFSVPVRRARGAGTQIHLWPISLSGQGREGLFGYSRAWPRS